MYFCGILTQGLQIHLNCSHDLFNFEYLVSYLLAIISSVSAIYLILLSVSFIHVSDQEGMSISISEMHPVLSLVEYISAIKYLH